MCTLHVCGYLCLGVWAHAQLEGCDLGNMLLGVEGTAAPRPSSPSLGITHYLPAKPVGCLEHVHAHGASKVRIYSYGWLVVVPLQCLKALQEKRQLGCCLACQHSTWLGLHVDVFMVPPLWWSIVLTLLAVGVPWARSCPGWLAEA